LCQCWLDSSNTPHMWPDIFRRVLARLPISLVTSGLLSIQFLVQLGTFATPTIHSARRRTIFFSQSALESHLVYDHWGIRSLRPEENLSTTLRKLKSQTSLLESSSLPMLAPLINFFFKFFWFYFFHSRYTLLHIKNISIIKYTIFNLRKRPLCITCGVWHQSILCPALVRSAADSVFHSISSICKWKIM